MATIASGFGTDCNRHGQRFQTNEMPGLVLALHHLTNILWFLIVLFFAIHPHDLQWYVMLCPVTMERVWLVGTLWVVHHPRHLPPPFIHLLIYITIIVVTMYRRVVFVTILTTSFFTELKTVAHRHWYGNRNTQIEIHKYPSNVMMMPRGQWWERLGIKQHQLWDRPQSLLRSRTRPRTLKLLHRLHKVEHSFAITRWSENIFTCNHQPALTLIAQVYQVAQYRLWLFAPTDLCRDDMQWA